MNLQFWNVKMKNKTIHRINNKLIKIGIDPVLNFVLNSSDDNTFCILHMIQ